MTEVSEYLGDSVYVAFEDGMVKLTTNNGCPDDPRNVIYMDIDVLNAFERWCKVALRVVTQDDAPEEAPESGN